MYLFTRVKGKQNLIRACIRAFAWLRRECLLHSGEQTTSPRRLNASGRIGTDTPARSW
jgi:hypothetical protein